MRAPFVQTDIRVLRRIVLLSTRPSFVTLLGEHMLHSVTLASGDELLMMRPANSATNHGS